MPKPGDFAEISPIRFLYYLINDLTTSCKMTQCLSTPGQVVQNQIAEKRGRMWLQSDILQKKLILLLLLYLEPFSMADISINVFIGTLTPAVTCHFNRLVAIVDDT